MIDISTSRAVMVVNANDLQTRDSLVVTLEYLGLHSFVVDSLPSAGITSFAGLGDLLHTEVEYHDVDRFEQRFFFVTGIELSFVFCGFRFATASPTDSLYVI
jgi:hypothetical protein